ncbi:hypothetical protein I79_019569 [Cricetulus griseus]|uniref:Uncharacterized protein n=1 Tax=Cricetulus griseus TaxID=10029 RepID=G3I7S1_CRIGR|nr:hypothetical protein I79_019569 [Cricetulus griseus]
MDSATSAAYITMDIHRLQGWQYHLSLYMASLQGQSSQTPGTLATFPLDTDTPAAEFPE